MTVFNPFKIGHYTKLHRQFNDNNPYLDSKIDRSSMNLRFIDVLLSFKVDYELSLNFLKNPIISRIPLFDILHLKSVLNVKPSRV
jgi:hypothetical protein